MGAAAGVGICLGFGAGQRSWCRPSGSQSDIDLLMVLEWGGLTHSILMDPMHWISILVVRSKQSRYRRIYLFKKLEE